MRKSIFFILLATLFALFARVAQAAPTRVDTLAATPASPTSITVCWTVPTPTTGKTLTVYDLRYSTVAVNTLNWATRTQVAGEPVPGTPGTQQCMTVSGLNVQTSYYFGLKAQDTGSATIWSTISNSAVTITYAAVKDIKISWDPPLLNSNGTRLDDLAGYKLYYGTSPGTYSTSIDVGNVTTYTVPNLDWGTTYYLTVSAYDKTGNEGLRATPDHAE